MLIMDYTYRFIHGELMCATTLLGESIKIINRLQSYISILRHFAIQEQMKTSILT